MSIIKVIEVIASSNKSFDDATHNAVAEAAKSVKNIKSVYIENMKAKVENNKISSYAVNAKISFEITNKDIS
ncbi:dodecin domain-containing protein [Cryomorpha ignava]|uniref:Dodecin domain-containing protein n=1 Tax=Cryomorpha ignava TaxID=101383 RepID=A0A7K3WSU3_9FLAO|nr:dodecin family protein [Cryomorpha ignava]NEN24759.1 dodecin domain-containing protein [Cryomorpha ignava]